MFLLISFFERFFLDVSLIIRIYLQIHLNAKRFSGILFFQICYFSRWIFFSSHHHAILKWKYFLNGFFSVQVSSKRKKSFATVVGKLQMNCGRHKNSWVSSKCNKQFEKLQVLQRFVPLSNAINVKKKCFMFTYTIYFLLAFN